MATVQDIIMYFFLFLTIYVEIFMLTTFFGNKSEIDEDGKPAFHKMTHFPAVTIIVPCYNEEKTVESTINSLLSIDYPKDKLKIIAVDDGSKDNTWKIIQQFINHPQIEVIHKENGGKYTALNIGIERANTEFVGCLDSDSFVDKSSLKKIMYRFQNDPEIMAVTPAIRIFKPHTLVQYVQAAEYQLAILAKKVQSFLGAIHVTPGPFTIFRKEVFKRIGLFKKAHNLEDMEMAFRMQSHHLKIANVHTAWVYTVGPKTFIGLYKQRLRWTYGFLENAKDYKFMFLNPEYGNVSFITLPTAFLFIFAVVFTIFFLFWRTGRFIFHKIIEWTIVGFHPHFHLSWFYLSARLNIFLSIVVFFLTLTLLVNAQNLVEGKMRPGKNIFYFFVLYPLISPFWILKSIYNSVFSKKTSWR